jgi:hypothetical protein
MNKLSPSSNVICNYYFKQTLLFLIILFTLISSFYLIEGKSIELSTSINNNTFYTLPILGDSIIEQVINTSENSTPFETNIQVDFVKGISTSQWWNLDYKYKIPIYINLSDLLTSDLNGDINSSFIINLDLSSEIDEEKLKSDYSDLRIVDLLDEVNYEILNLNSNIAKIKFRLSDFDNLSYINSTYYKKLDLYFGNSSKSSLTIDNSEVNLFIDTFENVNYWNITNGTYSISSNRLFTATSSFDYYNSISLTNIANTKNYEIYNYTNSPFTIDYSVSLYSNSEVDLIISNSSSLLSNLLNSSNDILLNLTLGYNETQSLCIENNCESINYEISNNNFRDIKIDITNSFVKVYIDNSLVKTKSHNDIFSGNPNISYGNYIALYNKNRTFVDNFKLAKNKNIDYKKGVIEEVLYSFDDTTFGGSYGWIKNITNYNSGEYSLFVSSFKDQYERNTSMTQLEFNRNKIVISLSEKGSINTFNGAYISNVVGSAKITNDNAKATSLNISLDSNSDLILSDYDNLYIINNTLFVNNLSAFSTLEFGYKISGITPYNPLEEETMLSTLIHRGNSDLSYYDFIQGKEIVESELTKPANEGSTSSAIDISSSSGGGSASFVLEDYVNVYGGYPVILVKKLSKEVIRYGDIVDVNINVRNIDSISKEIKIVDEIPTGFVMVDSLGRTILKDSFESTFSLNRRSSKELSYRIKYIGFMTGDLLINNAKAYLLDSLVGSNYYKVFLDSGKDEKLYVQKNIYYLANNIALISIDVVNLGHRTIDEFYLTEQTSANRIIESNYDRYSSNSWEILSLKPSEKRTIEYEIKVHEAVENDPLVYSNINDIDVEYNTRFVHKYQQVETKKVNFISIFFFSLIILGIAGMLGYVSFNLIKNNGNDTYSYDYISHRSINKSKYKTKPDNLFIAIIKLLNEITFVVINKIIISIKKYMQIISLIILGKTKLNNRKNINNKSDKNVNNYSIFSLTKEERKLFFELLFDLIFTKIKSLFRIGKNNNSNSPFKSQTEMRINNNGNNISNDRDININAERQQTDNSYNLDNNLNQYDGKIVNNNYDNSNKNNLINNNLDKSLNNIKNDEIFEEYDDDFRKKYRDNNKMIQELLNEFNK